MTRLNVLFITIALISALSIVSSQHRERKLFQLFEKEMAYQKALETEFGQLQLELSTWSTSQRIEKIAREKLQMQALDHSKIIIAAPVEQRP